MAKTIVTWCDAHLTSTGEEVPAESMRFTLGLSLPVEVDLCEVCRKELVDPLAEFLAEHGQPVKGDAEHEGAVFCPQCGKSYRQPASLRRHLIQAHGGAPEPTKAEPVPDRRSVVIPDGYPCPECDRKFDRPQALGRHRTHAHNYVSPEREAKQAKARRAKAKAAE